MATRRKPRAAKPRAATSRPVKSKAPASDNSSDVMLGGIGLGEIQRLIRLVRRTGIGELEISASGRTVRISATAGNSSGPPAPLTIPIAATAPSAAAPAAATPAADQHVAITSPMVGTFYRAPAPDADPYIETGDIVDVGQTVCIVEAMKLMNEIESEVRGRIVKILVENAQPVEFGQRLFLVEPV